MKAHELENQLNELLATTQIKDAALNGLQIGDDEQEIKSIALAVDTNLPTVREALLHKADLLLVHHGIFWGKSFALRGSDYQKIKLFTSHPLSLYAAHLPLDLHKPLGNNYQLCTKLKLENMLPFGYYHGTAIGFQGLFSGNPADLYHLVAQLSPTAQFYWQNKDRYQKIAIVSGNGGMEILAEAAQSEIDLLLVGELDHVGYNFCLDNALNIITLGHYESEKYGVMALGDYIQQEWSIPTRFIYQPTGF
jgi:dinuclear metal center YbgI/SA1388 family protein